MAPNYERLQNSPSETDVGLFPNIIQSLASPKPGHRLKAPDRNRHQAFHCACSHLHADTDTLIHNKGIFVTTSLYIAPLSIAQQCDLAAKAGKQR